ncbi:MAG: glycosyltransferase family 4 protein [Bryobacteraceae bacterium]
MTRWPILLLVRELGHGGCERDLTKTALGLDRSRFEPHVGCFRAEGDRGEQLRRGGVPIVELPVRSFRNWTAVRGAIELRRYIRRHGIRLVHSYDVPTALFATPVARACGVRAVLTSQLSYRELYSPREHRLLRGVDRLAHGIVVNCEAMRRHMIDDEGAAQKKILLCYNGVDTNVFQPRASERPAALRGARAVIGAVSNLRPEKGIDLLLRAFARMRREPGEIKCYIVGSGGCENDLRRLAKELGIDGDCVFQPGKANVDEDFRWIDIFALPSHSEAFSNALLEAMASGCAPVGSKVGGTPELIAPGESGLLFDPGSVEDLAAKLDELARGEAYRQRLAAGARLTAEKFSIERNLSCFQSIYESMLAQKALNPLGDARGSE